MFYHCDLLDPLLAKEPSTPVLIKSDGSRLTARELLSASKNLAYSLHQKGFRENDIAVITLAAGAEFLFVIYAVMILRGKVAIIDPEMGRANFKSKLNQLQPRWAFVDSRILLLNEHPLLRFAVFKVSKNVPYFQAPKGCTIISGGGFMPTVKKYCSIKKLLTRKSEPIVLSKNLAPHEFIVVYTSGTVQEPKGVVHTVEGLKRSIEHLVEILGKRRDDLIATDLPQYMMLGISAEIPVILLPSGLSAKSKLHWLERHRATILFSPPSEILSMVNQCEQESRRFPTCIRRILLGSAPVHTRFLKRLHSVAGYQTHISCLYGMTELLICAVIDSETKINYTSDGDVLGKPWKDVNCHIAADGEILLASPQLYARYFHEDTRPEYHQTGDMGYRDDNGYLILTGRKKDMIIRGNFNIYPGIYEGTIRRIEGVDDCALIGIWNESKDDEEVLLVVESEKLTADHVRKGITLGDHAIDRQALPDKIIMMQLPRSGRQNKVDKKFLRTRFQ